MAGYLVIEHQQEISAFNNFLHRGIPFQFPPLPLYYPPAPPAIHQNSNLDFLYYGFIPFVSVAVVVALCKLIVIGFCGENRRHHLPQTSNQSLKHPSQSSEIASSQLYPTFKYSAQEMQGQVSNECSVCLSAFEDGEDIRQLPHCKHSFHAPCIDMWLHSHSDCPLCRAKVDTRVSHSMVI